jgi:lipoprotein-releasing system permease protein
MAKSGFEQLIASRMLLQKDGEGRMSKPILRVAVAGIAIGIAVMILTLGVMTGFQNEVRQKVIGFGSHIQITGIDTNESFENDSLNRNQPSVSAVNALPGVRHVQVFATKAGIMKNKEQLLGVVLKGVDSDFDWSFFKEKMVEGKILTTPDSLNEVIVSKTIANKMQLKLNDKFRMFFLRNNETKQRLFKIVGIYETGLYDGFDDRFLICHLLQVQKLNKWDSVHVGGFEILVDNYNALQPVTESIRETLDYDLDAINIRELTPQIFSWLDILDTNAMIIIVLMLFVSMINMISAIIILILDRTNMIGVLKAMGAGNRAIMRIFMRQAVRLIGIGLLWGNAVGVVVGLAQNKFGLIQLDERSYYVDHVPVEFIAWQLIILNLATLVLCILALLIPALIVTRISPVKAIRFS